jgi:hypothetical protein
VSWKCTAADIEKLIATEVAEYAVREIKANDSPRIREYQKVTGNAPPDSWCMSFQRWSLLMTFGRKNFPPLLKSGSCEQVRRAARKLGWIYKTPGKGRIGLLIDLARDRAHHAFLCTGSMTSDQRFPTFEGNTNPSGGREGYGCFPRARRMGGTLHYEFIRLPRE